MFITQNGILMRTRVSEIRETGRNAQGVRLIKLGEGDRLVAMAKVDAEPERAADGSASPAPGDAPAASAEAPANEGNETPSPDASPGEGGANGSADGEGNGAEA